MIIRPTFNHYSRYMIKTFKDFPLADISPRLPGRLTLLRISFVNCNNIQPLLFNDINKVVDFFWEATFVIKGKIL